MVIVIMPLISGCIEENHELHWNDYDEDILTNKSDNAVILLYFQLSFYFAPLMKVSNYLLTKSLDI